MAGLLCVGDRVLWRGGFGADEAKVARVVAIERCASPRSKYGERVPEVEWDLREYLNVTLDDGSWAYGDQIEPYDVALRFRATVERWSKPQLDALFAALRAWATADEGFSERECFHDVLGDPGRPTIYSPRIVRRPRTWPAESEARLRARVEAVGGGDVRVEATFL